LNDTKEVEVIKTLFYGLITFIAAILLTACGGTLPTPAPTPAAGETPITMPPGKATPDVRYGYAPDYSWARGELQIMQGRDNVTCWILQYDPAAADQYGGKFYLMGNMPDVFKQGDFVQVRGQVDISMGGPARPPCDVTPYQFTSIEPISGVPSPGSAATPVPEPTDLTQPPGRITPTPQGEFGHADDYSWLKGYLKFNTRDSCHTIVYGGLEKDQYGGMMYLIGANLEGFQDGDFVVVYGQLDPGLRDTPPCLDVVQGYEVKAMERQPGQGGEHENQPYGHAPDYSWLRGQIKVTQIQGGCTFLIYDPLGSDQYGGKVVPLGDLDGIRDGEFVMVSGQFSAEPGPMCPGAYYTVTSIRRQ
jgi:hypothetical protein